MQLSLFVVYVDGTKRNDGNGIYWQLVHVANPLYTTRYNFLSTSDLTTPRVYWVIWFTASIPYTIRIDLPSKYIGFSDSNSIYWSDEKTSQARSIILKYSILMLDRRRRQVLSISTLFRSRQNDRAVTRIYNRSARPIQEYGRPTSSLAILIPWTKTTLIQLLLLLLVWMGMHVLQLCYLFLQDVRCQLETGNNGSCLLYTSDAADE